MKLSIGDRQLIHKHEQHFTSNTPWDACQQLTITANHHHEGAPLTVALISGKEKAFRGSCVACVTARLPNLKKKASTLR